jgi:3-hydroxyisobutyrate dehydrogenase-like beta-hydroxyacid dehydrogenase
MISAPVSGTVPAAADGSLIIMAGGPLDVVSRIEPLLYRLGRQVAYVGTPSQALVLKLAINVNLATQILAFSEALLLTEEAGIDRAQAASIMTDSIIGSPAIRDRAPLTLHLPDRAWFEMTGMRKDLRHARDTAADFGIPMASAAIAAAAVDLAIDHGFGHRDLAGLYTALRKRRSPALLPASVGVRP